jgi:transcriptional regulator with XRE-family HTH domain
MRLMPVTCRMARAALGWTQEKLAAESNVTPDTIRDFERRGRQPHINHLIAITAALERGGISFTIAPSGQVCPHLRDNSANPECLGI